MTYLAPPVVQAKLLRILHRAFVESRNLAMDGKREHLHELADTFELLPELMAQWDETTLDRIRNILAEYESAHPQSSYDYLSLLDEDVTDFHANGFNAVAGRGEKTGLSE